MLIARNTTNASPTVTRGLIASVQTSLQNHDGKTVVRVGEGMPRRWQIAH